VGAVIMQMVGRQEWNTGAIDKHLGLAAPQPLGFYDRTMWRAAKLYLPKEFTISIRTYAGTAVQGDSFPNHIGGMQDPPDQ
jgi:phospholipase C